MNAPIEDRLRAAMRSRADAVEPETIPGDLRAIERRIVTARRDLARRRVLLSAAAAIVVVGAVLGAGLLTDDEGREDIDIAGVPEGSTRADFAGPNLWPASLVEARFADPADAADSFWSNYLGLGESCPVATGPTSDVATVIVGCDGDLSTVFLRSTPEQGWFVTGARSASIEVTAPSPGDTVPRRFDLVVDRPDRVEVEVRDLGLLHAWFGPTIVTTPVTVDVPADHESTQVVIAAVGTSATVFAIELENDVPPTVTTAPSHEFEVAPPGPDALAIWPGPSDALAPFPSAHEAASDFMASYVGLPATCSRDVEGTDTAAVVICQGTEVQARLSDDAGWVVTGAESARFDIEHPAPASTFTVDDELAMDRPELHLELRRLFDLDPLAEGDPVVLPEAGDFVVVVTDGTSATVRAISVEPEEEPAGPTALESCGVEVDDGVQGWPGDSPREFADPEGAALAFASEVLDLAEPTVVGVDGGRVTIQNRPSAGARTEFGVVDVGGSLRVLCSTSDQGSIDDVQLAGDTITVSGVATAFEATVTIQALAADGTLLAETFTQAGANGEFGPYEATLELGGRVPQFILIAEGDASGEGRFTWATMRLAS